MKKPIKKLQKTQFIPVDLWKPSEEDKIFNHAKGAIFAPISLFYGYTNDEMSSLNTFVMMSKKCYNSNTTVDKNGKVTPGFREHCTHYLNYFTKFYDHERELLTIYCKIKFLIDCVKEYDKEALFNDIRKYIMSPTMYQKVMAMNEDNYNLKLTYKNNNNKCLEYDENHAKMLMEISLFINMIIPLTCHFIHVNKVIEIKYFLLDAFDIVISSYKGVNFYNKLFETAITTINKNATAHETLFDKQSIRGHNTTTHSIYAVETILLQIIPKYTYEENKNIICFNYQSIIRNIRYNVTDIKYEFSFIPLSSSSRDEDNNSEFDKFEATIIAQDESLYLQNKVNCEKTMERIDSMYGPFSEEEINFYKVELTRDGKPLINDFQKRLIFNLFYKYFGDPVSIKAINKDDYVKLLIAAKRILDVNKMVILPYIISSRVVKTVPRKHINKKELYKLENSESFNIVKEKYKNPHIEKEIFSIIAKILSSEFQIIDFYDEELNGRTITKIPEFICEEVLMYIILIDA